VKRSSSWFHPLVVAATAALVLFSTTGLAAIYGWMT
jgi:hypothetical protein